MDSIPASAQKFFGTIETHLGISINENLVASWATPLENCSGPMFYKGFSLRFDTLGMDVNLELRI